MEEIPPGAHLFQMPQIVPPPPAKTRRTITFKNCNLGFIVNVDPDGRVAGYEMQIHDEQEATVYVFGFDETLRDTFCDHLISLPGVGTVPHVPEAPTQGRDQNGDGHAA